MKVGLGTRVKVMASKMKYLCGVCDKPFLTVSSRNKHERVNRKCSEANSGRVNIVKVPANLGHESEGPSVEFTLDDSKEGGKQCSFCFHKFTKLANAHQHVCLLSPSVSPEYTVLKLVGEDDAVELKEIQRFSSAYQNMRTCHIMRQAVPGVFPLIFTGAKVGGRSASSLLQRLKGFGCVGSPAYASLRQALSEVTEVRLPLCVTIYLPGGGVVSLGKDLTVPSNRKELGDLRVRIERGEIIVMRVSGGGAGGGGGGGGGHNGEGSGDNPGHNPGHNDCSGGGGGVGHNGGGSGDNPGHNPGYNDYSEGGGGGGGGGGNPGHNDDGGGGGGHNGGGGGGNPGHNNDGGGGGGHNGGGGGGNPGHNDDGGGGGGDGNPSDYVNGGGGSGQPSLQQLKENNLFRHPEFMTEKQLHQVSFIHSFTYISVAFNHSYI